MAKISIHTRKNQPLILASDIEEGKAFFSQTDNNIIYIIAVNSTRDYVNMINIRQDMKITYQNAKNIDHLLTHFERRDYVQLQGMTIEGIINGTY